MQCPKCGSSNPDGVKFCGNCGENLVVAASPMRNFEAFTILDKFRGSGTSNCTTTQFPEVDRYRLVDEADPSTACRKGHRRSISTCEAQRAACDLGPMSEKHGAQCHPPCWDHEVSPLATAARTSDRRGISFGDPGAYPQGDLFSERLSGLLVGRPPRLFDPFAVRVSGLFSSRLRSRCGRQFRDMAHCRLSSLIGRSQGSGRLVERKPLQNKVR